MFRSILILLGLGLIMGGGWMQLTEPDYREVRRLLHLSDQGVVLTGKQPVPGALIATLFIVGGVLFGVGVMSED
jgi:hypothetical protein